MKKKSCSLLTQLEVNRTVETNKWNDIKVDIGEVLQSQLKSIELNTRLYEEYGRKFQQQSNAIEAAYQEIRELVSKLNETFFTQKMKINFDHFACFFFCSLHF